MIKPSVFGLDFWASDTTGMIGIFCHGTSRTVYIESGAEQRHVTRYTLAYEDSFFNEEPWSDWCISQLDCTKLGAIAKELKLLESTSQRCQKIAVSHDDLITFKTAMDKHSNNPVVNGTQDANIARALETIEQTMELPENYCSIL